MPLDMTAVLRYRPVTRRLGLAEVLPQLLRWNAALAVYMLPIGVTITRIAWVQPFIMVCDLALILAVLLGFAQIATRTVPRSALFVAGLIFIGGQLVSYVANPSVLGVIRILRTFGILVIAETLASLAPQTRVKFEKAIVSVGVFEVVLMLAHRIRGEALFPGWIEAGRNVFGDGNSQIGVGSLQHQYVLAGLGLLVGAVSVLGLIRSTLPPIWAFSGIGACAYLAVQSVGRGAFLGVAVLTFSLLVALRTRKQSRRNLFVALLVLSFGSALGFAVTLSSWSGRSQGGASIASDSGRMPLINQAIGLWKSSPVTGVGPGQYSVALLRNQKLSHLTDTFLPVHDVPLHIAAETGVFGVLPGMIFGYLLWKRLRNGGFDVLLPAGAIAPFLLFDVFHWVIPAGTLQLGVFVGLLAYRNIGSVTETKPAIGGSHEAFTPTPISAERGQLLHS
jgi:O-Antigen ligase